MRPTLFVVVLYLNIPDEAFYHPVIRKIEDLVAELVAIDNVGIFSDASPSSLKVPARFQDILSYNKEQAVGDDRCNLLMIIMHRDHRNLQKALEHMLKLHQDGQARLKDLIGSVQALLWR